MIHFTVAVKPCQRERMRAMAMRNRTVVGMFIPSCQPDGSYNLIQCHNVTGFCWCVDNLGNILTGTRKWGKPNCTRIGKLNFIRSLCSKVYKIYTWFLQLNLTLT